MSTQYAARRGPFSVTTDRARFDVDVIHGFLRRAYWSPGVPRETSATIFASW